MTLRERTESDRLRLREVCDEIASLADERREIEARLYALPTAGIPEAFTFRVPGLPRPQPRPRYDRRHDRIYTPDTARRWREAVAWLAMVARGGRAPFTGPVELRLDFVLPDNRKADLDNLCKSSLDAIVESGAMRDDNQVVALHATKRVGKDTGCCVSIAAMEALG